MTLTLDTAVVGITVEARDGSLPEHARAVVHTSLSLRFYLMTDSGIAGASRR